MSASPLFKKPSKSRSNIRSRATGLEDVADGDSSNPAGSSLARTSTMASNVHVEASSSPKGAGFSSSDAGPLDQKISLSVEFDPAEEEGDATGSFSSPMMLAKQRKKEKDKRKLGSPGIGTSAVHGRPSPSSSRLSFGVADDGTDEGMAQVDGGGPSRPNSSTYESPVSKAFVPRKSTLSQSISASQRLDGSFSTVNLSSDQGKSQSPSSGGVYDLAGLAGGRKSSSSYLDKYGSTPSRTKSALPSSSVRYTSGASTADHEEGEAMLVDEVEYLGSSSGARTGGGPNRRPRYVEEELDHTEGIPDEARIAAAKIARRKALLGASGAGDDARDSIEGQEDYVDLAGGGGGRGRGVRVHDEDEEDGLGRRMGNGPHPESRLQREDDEDDEGDEDLADYTEANTKINLTTKANKAAARRLKTEMLEAIDDREGEDVDDEDAMEWESAQARAGGGDRKHLDQTPDQPISKRKAYKIASAPATRPIPTITGASNRLNASLGLLESSTAQRASQLLEVERELGNLDTQEEELRQEVERVEAKKEWMEDFRGWVETLGGFLEEKFPVLEAIEKDALRHYSERRDIVGKRRAEDDSDDLALFLGVAPSKEEREDGEPEVDEMGRTRRRFDLSGPHSGVRRARREERQARRDRRRSTQTSRKVQEEDGFSTDSELGEADREDYQAAQNALLARVKALSNDVAAEDFRDPVLGLATRFGGWRKSHEEEYTNAYGGLAMVQAWEYWARSEMANWEPSRASISLDSFGWYHALHEYSRPPDPQANIDIDVDEEHPLGPDGDLVPAMVSSAVTVLITKYVEAGGYDLYSTAQTRRLVDLVDMVGEHTGKDHPKYRAILRAVLLVFHSHIDSLSSAVSDIVLNAESTPPPAFDPATRTSLLSYINRRIKLIRTLLAWKRYVPLGDLNTLIGKLISETIRPGLQRCWYSGGQEMSSKILLLAPDGTLSDDLKYFLGSGPIGTGERIR